jgi:hypothetical protein
MSLRLIELSRLSGLGKVAIAYLKLSMLSLKQLRDLEPSLRDLPDDEVAIIREQIYAMAQLAYDSYKEQRDSKFAVGLGQVDDKK